MKKLIRIQETLKAPKNQTNNFGKYKYRSCEDILEAVKPLLAKEELLMLISDQVVNIGNKNYVKATATIIDGDKQISVSAYAREAETRKGMDDSQLTGSTSSYARKYALNGLFLIDDTKDADTNENRSETEPKIEEVKEIQIKRNEIAIRIKTLRPDLDISKYRGFIKTKTGETYDDKTGEKTIDEILEKLEVLVSEKNDI